MENKVLAWHFLRDDGSYCNNDSKLCPSGLEIIDTSRYPLELYTWGLHASCNLLDALECARGCLLRRVELSGEIVKYRNEVCATRRRELWRMNIAGILHGFGHWCAKRAIKHLHEPCPQFEEALKMKQMWLRYECYNETLRKMHWKMQNNQENETSVMFVVDMAISFNALIAGRGSSRYLQQLVMEETGDYSAMRRERSMHCRKLLTMVKKVREERNYD